MVLPSGASVSHGVAHADWHYCFGVRIEPWRADDAGQRYRTPWPFGFPVAKFLTKRFKLGMVAVFTRVKFPPVLCA